MAQPNLNRREIEILTLLSNGRSDQQIADALFLSLNTIKWYNRQIYGKLEVGSRTEAIAYALRFGLLHQGAKKPSVAWSGSMSLPVPTTRFIGRGREIAEVKQRLGTSRLVTLTGTGGAGKTRLALRVAAEVAAEFADGVYFIDLAPISDPTHVPKAIARTLGVMENPSEPLPSTLKRALSGRASLLLIDNFEQVVEAAPLITELLQGAPRMKILVTSRSSLRLSGEHEYPVPPLSLPSLDIESVRHLTESEAGSLFIQRAQMTQPLFAATEENASAIAQICTRLDGLPLAIELAAARSKLLTPQALLERLEGGDAPFRALDAGSRDAPPRQRTLRDSITWSHDLLDANEKRLFARMAVFRGGMSLEAIEAVCGEGLSTDVIDVLASLVDKSLVQQKESPGGALRFSMLELIHAFARERLDLLGEADAVRVTHARYFVSLAERAEPELRLARYDEWCEQFELELENLRAVLDWSLTGGDLTLGVRLAAALGLFWYGKGHHLEGIRWMERLLDHLGEVPVRLHPGFLISAGHLTWIRDLDASARLFQRALKIARETGDVLQSAWALAFLGYARQQRRETALPEAEQALALFRALDHPPGIAQTLNIIGEIHRINGDDHGARHAYEMCLSVCRETGEARRICYMLNNLAYITQHEGNHARALELARQSLSLARKRKDDYDAAWALTLIAGSIGALGEPRRATQLLGASESVLQRIGALHQPSDQPEHDRITAELRARLDAAAFQDAWDAGQHMTLENATIAALQDAP